MFKVVPDQLKISDGWVRCGHCADVFDATLYLEAWTPPAPAAPVADTESAFASEPVVATVPAEPLLEQASYAPQTAPEAAPEALGRVSDAHWRPEEAVAGPQSTQAQVAEVPAFELAEVPVPESVIDNTGGAEPAPTVPSAGESGDWLVSPEIVADLREQEQAAQAAGQTAVFEPGVDPFAAVDPVPPVAAASPVALASDPPLPATPLAPAEPREAEADFQTDLERFAAVSSGAADRIRADLTQASDPVPAAFAEPQGDGALTTDEPGFIRQAKRQALWRSPGVRAALGVLGALLALLLAAQWALHERDRLAASHPDLAPLLARLCEPLGCEVGPVQRIDAVVIDSSTLVRRLGNFYSFDLVLKNAATMPVAVPALELSLTDSSDRVIARRVFLQQELPDAPRLLPAQGSLSLSLRLSITEGGSVSMAGYRALVFYP